MTSAPLGELVDIRGGGTPRRDNPAYWNGNIPWATVKDFKTTEISKTLETISEPGVKESATSVIPAGNIIVPTRMALGKVAINRIDLAINQDLKALLIHDRKRVDGEYLFRFLLSKSAYIEGQGKGATVKGITLDVLRELEVPLPSLAEQKRIAAILDKADAIRRKRQQAIQLADEFLRSVFLDMFGDPFTNPKRWPVVRLDELAEKVTDGTHQSPKWTADGVPFLFISNIVNQQINFETEKFIAEETFRELTRITPIELGDVLYTTVGSYGNAALVNSNRKFCFQRHIAHIKPDRNKVIPEFLWAMMNSPGVRRQADKQARGVAQKTLNLGELKSFLVFSPSFPEQERFVKLIRKVGSVKEGFAIGNEASLQLFRSTSQRAFRGEL